MIFSPRRELQNVLQTFTRKKAPLILPESVSSRSERKKRTSFCHRMVKKRKDALKKLKTRKAPGPDGITGEILKNIGACSRAVLL